MTDSAENKSKPDKPPPNAHDAPGLSPLERMTELTRRVVNVPAKELAKAKKRQGEKGHNS